MKAIGGMLALVALLGFLAYFFLADRDRGRPMAQPKDAIGDALPGTEGRARRNGNESRDEVPAERAAEDVDAPVVAEQAPRQLVNPLRVRCVLKGSQEPVVGVSIYVVDPQSQLLFGQADGPSLPVEEVLARLAPDAISDDLGLAEVPRPSSFSNVLAQTEGLFGDMARYSPGVTGDVVIELSPRRFVEVEVVDSEGRAQADVGLAFRMGPPTLPRIVEFERCRTDAEGKARLLFNILAPVARELSDRMPIAVGVLGLFESPVEKFFDCGTPPTEPLRLVLPPCGRVLVRALPGAPDSGSRMTLSLPGEATAMTQSFAGSEAILFPIGLGLSIDYHYLPPLASFDAEQSWKGAGPVGPGETLVVELDRDAVAKRSRLTAQLVDSRGLVPEASRATFKAVTTGTNVPGAPIASVDLDPEGRFKLGLPPELHDQLASTGLWIVVEQSRGLTELIRIEARSLPPGETDLGRLVLESLPLAIAGRVVDEKGKGLEGVFISPSGSKGRALLGREAHFTMFSTITDSAGRFEIRDRVSFDSVEMTAHSRDRDRGRVTQLVRIGDPDCVFRLVGATRLRARFVAASGERLSALVVSVVALEESGRNYGLIPNAEGQISHELAPGRYDVIVQPDAGEGRMLPEVVAEWRNLEIVEGQVTDLGETKVVVGGIQVEVAIELPEGMWADYINYNVYEPGHTSSIASGSISQKGELVAAFKVKSLPAELAVNASGIGGGRKIISQTKDRIRIESGPKLHLKIRNKATIPKGSQIYVRAFNRFGEGANAMLVIDGDDLQFCDLIVPEPGQYTLMIQANGQQVALVDEAGNSMVSPSELEVLKSAERQEFEIEIKAAAVPSER